MTRRARLLGNNEMAYFNKFMADHEKGHVLQSYQWGQVKAFTGWKPYYLVVEEDAKIIAAVMLLKREIPLIKKGIFYAPRGPVVDYKDGELFTYTMDAIKKLAGEEQVIFLKIDPDIPSSNEVYRQSLKEQGFISAERGGNFEGLQPKYVFRLDITPDQEQLMASFHQKTRYNIRLAQKKGVQIKTDCTREDLNDFYAILQVTAQRDRFLIRSKSYFDVIWDQLVDHGLAKLFMAYHEGRPIAGTLLLTIGEKAWYLYGASANEHRNLMPNYLLQSTMIQWAKEQGCTLYDFRGVPGELTEDNPIYGLYRFKKGFHAEYTEFVGEYDCVYAPLLYRLWLIGEPLYSKMLISYSKFKKKLRGK